MSTAETKVKERPILFSGPMVRAILEGRKTQTRRVMNPQPPGKQFFLYKTGQDIGFYMPESVTGYRMTGAVGVARDAMGGTWPKNSLWRCPYGSVGERLWVRETCWSDGCTIYYTADSACRSYSIEDRDTEKRLLKLHHYANGVGDKVPSIHMPRWASRITLEITGVRAERLNDISEADALAEGCDGNCQIGYIPAYQAGPNSYHFAQLWESINGPKSWELNPWVWVVEFKRIGNL